MIPTHIAIAITRTQMRSRRTIPNLYRPNPARLPLAARGTGADNNPPGKVWARLSEPGLGSLDDKAVEPGIIEVLSHRLSGTEKDTIHELPDQGPPQSRDRAGRSGRVHHHQRPYRLL